MLAARVLESLDYFRARVVKVPSSRFVIQKVPELTSRMIHQEINWPNHALEPTRLLVTNRAFPHFVRARFAPSNRAAQLVR